MDRSLDEWCTTAILSENWQTKKLKEDVDAVTQTRWYPTLPENNSLSDLVENFEEALKLDRSMAKNISSNSVKSISFTNSSSSNEADEKEKLYKIH